MANLKEVRNRITSVNSTMQITSAMKMVSAAKLKRAQDAVNRIRPFARKLSVLLSHLTDYVADDNIYFYKRKAVKRVLLIPITSNRGLCGGFNMQVIKATVGLISGKYADKDVQVLSIGKKVSDFMTREGHDILNDSFPTHFNDVFNDLRYAPVADIAQLVMNRFTDGTFDEVVLVYNTAKNAATQEVVKEPFLPISTEVLTDDAPMIDYDFEPNKDDVLDVLVPKSLKTQLFKAILDSFSGEQGARMTAMHKATDNASDLLKDLKLSYNKARQTAITTEILEIVSGAEAMNA